MKGRNKLTDLFGDLAQLSPATNISTRLREGNRKNVDDITKDFLDKGVLSYGTTWFWWLCIFVTNNSGKKRRPLHCILVIIIKWKLTRLLIFL